MFTSSVRRLSSTVGSKIPWTVKLPPKWQGGFIEKWGNYWAGVAQDYRDVAVEIITNAYKKPLKSAAIYSLIGGATYAFCTNPDEREFRNCLKVYMNESAMLSANIRNPDVDSQFNYLVDCYNHGLVRRLSLGFVSLLWVDNYAKVCGVFKAQCDYLQPQYLTFHERVMDVGFCGYWWGLERKMEEFDVNPEEWKDEEAM